MDGYHYNYNLDRGPTQDTTYNSSLTSDSNSDVSEGLIIFIIFISFSSSLFEMSRYMIKSCLQNKRNKQLVIHILTSVDEERGDDCIICLDKYVKDDTLIELSCHHNFHEACILPWINDNNTCPHCRRIII